jgi:hypothetical protein
MTVSTTGVSGTFDVEYTLSGSYFSDIYYGFAPTLITITGLSGTSNNFSSIELQLGSSFNDGSILIGSKISGALQTFSFDSRTVIDVLQVPDLKSNNVEDFS